MNIKREKKKILRYAQDMHNQIKAATTENKTRAGNLLLAMAEKIQQECNEQYVTPSMFIGANFHGLATKVHVERAFSRDVLQEPYEFKYEIDQLAIMAVTCEAIAWDLEHYPPRIIERSRRFFSGAFHETVNHMFMDVPNSRRYAEEVCDLLSIAAERLGVMDDRVWTIDGQL